MAQAFHVSTSLDLPAEQVWDRLTDWPRAAEWMSGVDTIHTDGDTDVGTTLVFRTRGKERTSQITALDPGRSITLTSVQGGVTAAYTYACEPHGKSTTVTLTADCHTSGLLWNLAAGVIRAAIRRTDSTQLQAFKHVIESGQTHG